MPLILKLYSLIHLILLPFILPFEILKRAPKRRSIWLKEKFGFVALPGFSNQQKTLWVHAVSLGEIKAITKFLELVADHFNICLTTTTETGRAYAENLVKEIPNLKVFYNPFDLGFSIKRFLKKINPSALVIVETELWPNMIYISSRSLPIFLINARLSNKSFKNYKALSFFFKPLLNRFSAICVQNEIYLHKFKELGVIPDKLYLTGNLKFDITIKFLEFEKLQWLRRPIIIAGSTHEGEEELILKEFVKLKYQASLLLVPRHPERFDKVYKLCLSRLELRKNTLILKYSEIENSQNKELLKDLSPYQKVVVVVDKIGILASLYRIADLAIIGGSFIPHGGQNPLEAIYWKVPVIVGPYMENFPFVEDFIKEETICQVKPGDLAHTIDLILSDKILRKKLVERAYNLFLSLTGGSVKTLEIIKSTL